MTFHYTDWFLEILLLAYKIIPIYKKNILINNQLFLGLFFDRSPQLSGPQKDLKKSHFQATGLPGMFRIIITVAVPQVAVGRVWESTTKWFRAPIRFEKRMERNDPIQMATHGG